MVRDAVATKHHQESRFSEDKRTLFSIFKILEGASFMLEIVNDFSYWRREVEDR